MGIRIPVSDLFELVVVSRNWVVGRCKIDAACCRRNEAVDQDAVPLADCESNFDLEAGRWYMGNRRESLGNS